MSSTRCGIESQRSTFLLASSAFGKGPLFSGVFPRMARARVAGPNMALLAGRSTVRSILGLDTYLAGPAIESGSEGITAGHGFARYPPVALPASARACGEAIPAVRRSESRDGG